MALDVAIVVSRFGFCFEERKKLVSAGKKLA